MEFTSARVAQSLFDVSQIRAVVHKLLYSRVPQFTSDRIATCEQLAGRGDTPETTLSEAGDNDVGINWSPFYSHDRNDAWRTGYTLRNTDESPTSDSIRNSFLYFTREVTRAIHPGRAEVTLSCDCVRMWSRQIATTGTATQLASISPFRFCPALTLLSRR
jgi:hypothetical protein